MTTHNGMTLDELMTYDDLLESLKDDREETIDILSETRASVCVEYDGLIESLRSVLELNEVYRDSDYYLQDDQILYRELVNAYKEVYNYMSNEEIVEWYRENEPYVFDPIGEMNRIFNL